MATARRMKEIASMDKQSKKVRVETCTHCGRYKSPKGKWFQGVDTGEAIIVPTICPECQETSK